MSSLIFLQQVDPGARNAPKSVPNVKKLSLSEFPVCSACQKLGVYRHLPMKAQPYFLLPNKRAGGKKSDGRRVWHFVDRERRPRKRRDPEGRSVWHVTYNHDAAGSDVWLQAWVFVFVRTTVATVHQTGHKKKSAFRSACSEAGSMTSPVKEKADLTKFQLNLLRVTTPMMESSWPDEVDLSTVTICNKSMDSEPVETDGKRGRYREITVDSGAGESLVNPDEWPNVDLKPSKGSVKGQRYVAPGGEKI